MGRRRSDTVGSAAKHGKTVHFQTRIVGDEVVGRCSCGRWRASISRAVEVPQTVLASLWRQHVQDVHPGFS